MTDAQTLADRYIATWNATDDALRQTLLQQGWTEDASYVDPQMQGRGPHEIGALVTAVHQRFPGFRFTLASKPEMVGQHLRFSWALGPAAQPDLIQGTDFIETANGRLKSVVGFLDKVPDA